MDFIEKIPNFWRWILIPISSIFTWLLVLFVGKIVGKLVVFIQAGLGYSENFFEYLLNPGLAGYFAVLIAILFAPRKKRIVGIVLGVFWVMVAGIMAFAAVLISNWASLLAAVATLIGCGVAIYQANEEYS